MLGRNQSQNDKKPKLMMAVIEVGIEARPGKEPVVSSVKILQSANKSMVHKMVTDFQAEADEYVKNHGARGSERSLVDTNKDTSSSMSAHPSSADEFVDSLPQLTDADLLVAIDGGIVLKFLGDKDGERAATEEKDSGGVGSAGGGRV